MRAPHALAAIALCAIPVTGCRQLMPPADTDRCQDSNGVVMLPYLGADPGCDVQRPQVLSAWTDGTPEQTHDCLDFGGTPTGPDNDGEFMCWDMDY